MPPKSSTAILTASTDPLPDVSEIDRRQVGDDQDGEFLAGHLARRPVDAISIEAPTRRPSAASREGRASASFRSPLSDWFLPRSCGPRRVSCQEDFIKSILHSFHARASLMAQRNAGNGRADWDVTEGGDQMAEVDEGAAGIPADDGSVARTRPGRRHEILRRLRRGERTSSISFPRRRHLRDHRTERRRQDDAVQPAQRLSEADPGQAVPPRRQDVTRLPPAAIARRGVVRSFQITSIFANLTVAENLVLPIQRREGRRQRVLRRSRWRQQNADEIDDILRPGSYPVGVARPGRELPALRPQALARTRHQPRRPAATSCCSTSRPRA